VTHRHIPFTRLAASVRGRERLRAEIYLSAMPNSKMDNPHIRGVDLTMPTNGKQNLMDGLAPDLCKKR
jgi:hypothetical protein